MTWADWTCRDCGEDVSQCICVDEEERLRQFEYEAAAKCKCGEVLDDDGSCWGCKASAAFWRD